MGLDSKGLRQLVARQLLVLTYVDERLGARVFVGPDELNRYYREVLTPEMQKRGQQPPPLEDVREDIRETLKQQKMTQEMAKWTQDLRTKADIAIYSPAQQANRPLPPVVKTIAGKKVDPKKAEPAGKNRRRSSTAPHTAPTPPAPAGHSRGSRWCRSWCRAPRAPG